MTLPDDWRFMALALALGRRGRGAVWPNPAVGCVIVRDGRIVGRGWTRPGGRPHAESIALAQAGAAARGATAYVSLEPCAHHGRTPPCAEGLIAAGIARVVTPLDDPDPRVAGGGHAMLTAAGVAVTTGVLASAARRDHRGFLTRMRHGRPMVTLKLAGSFDGRIATATGESRWITGPGARHRVHGQRLSHDAVLIGGGTARADDPALTVRGFGEARQPVRIVVSRRLNLPREGRLGRTTAQAPLWLAHGDGDSDASPADRGHWSALGAELLPVPPGPGGQIDPAALMSALGGRGLTRVLCEGGGALAASLLADDLVDELIGFTAGLALGAEGRPMLGAMGLDQLADAPRFRLIDARQVGADVMHHWERAAVDG